MFKQLGMFGVLAVCLFAIVIAMVGCGPDDKPPPPPPVETPMEKLTGSYDLVEISIGILGVMRPPEAVGQFSLPSTGSWSVSYSVEGALTADGGGPSWSATSTTLTITFSDGSSETLQYLWIGESLKVTFPGEPLTTITWE